MRKENQSLLKQGARPEDQRKRHRRAKKTKALNITMQQKSAGRTKKLQNIFRNRKMFFFVFSFMILKEI
jgi:hypothetical protein